MTPQTFEFTTEDIEYLRHGVKPLSRYRNALRERAKGTDWVGDIPEPVGRPVEEVMK